ncbi:hypothetical protein HN018_27795 (plasmid) [Lichenicola cladoniae]|uniref:Transposase n=1 Tax=Lichenicola cladoniae TaxID=1484109 RepID=A0A6M8HZG4_9PROT|nr:hypothetical protein [Lichenicola cladoniae]NPD69559.1 hypothetical protein [Acetobacteraceae bacterium]QKE93923.1 hypothetical protein HN018_27795 [Lichenicola cladoniae]
MDLWAAVERAQQRVLKQISLPSDIIAFVVFCRRRYRLTQRDSLEILALRGTEVTYKPNRDWVAKLLPILGDALRKHGRSVRRGCTSSLYVDKTDLTVRGRAGD